MSCGIRINLSLRRGAGSSLCQPCEKFSRPRNISEVTVEYASYYLDVIVAPRDNVFLICPTYLLLVLLYEYTTYILYSNIDIREFD